MSSKNSPNRRRSMAAVNQNKPNSISRSRRRPHSIVAGERLSPLAKARRSLAPRKSILKGSIMPPSEDLQQPEPSSSQLALQPPPNSQGNSNDSIATSSQDATREFSTVVHDNVSRKSLGRRVSFASHAQVRVFEKENNTNGTSSPQSSPAQPSAEPKPPPPPQAVTDENAYPGASKARRRSSVRKSVGFAGEDGDSEDMDMDETGIAPSAWLASQNTGSAVEDDYEDESSTGEADMELTMALAQRKKSLGGAPRRALSIIPSSFVPQHSYPTDDQDGDISQYDEGSSINSTQSHSDMDTGHSDRPIEYEHPLTKPLKPPSEAWLALRSMTHSGDAPASSEDEEGGSVQMGLTDAVDRLLRAKPSLPLASSQTADEDSFMSTDDSYNENIDQGDKTLNMSKVLGRPSIGGHSLLDSTMDVTNAFGGVMEEPIAAQSIPSPQASSAPPIPPSVFSLPNPPAPAQNPSTQPLEPRRPSVFQPPPKAAAPEHPSSPPRAPPKVFSTPQPAPSQRPPSSATIPKPFTFSFTPKPTTSPTKSKPGSSVRKPQPKFSAAFAPPVGKVSPKKRTRGEAGFGEDDVGEDGPSGRKKLAMVAPALSKDHDEGQQEEQEIEEVGLTQPSEPTSKPTDTPQAVPAPTHPTEVNPPAQKPPGKSTTTSLRRPSSYFARRKSLGVGLAAPALVDPPAAGSSSLLQKKPAGGMGRVSMGGAASGLFSKEPLKPLYSGNGGGKGREDPHHCEREVSKQAVASPTVTRGSPAPGSPRLGSPRVSAEETLDFREMLGKERGFGEDVEVDGDEDGEIPDGVTEQWRDGVAQDGLNDEEVPSISIEQFFEMTGIKFMDDITAPRRSTIHPLQLQPRQRRGSIGGMPDIPLAEYAVAMTLDVPQMELFTHVTKDLQAWIDQSKEVYKQAEEEAAKVTPELFREYALANEEGQGELLQMLTLIKANTRGLAKSEWYDWKLQWVNGLYEEAVKGFSDLEADAKIIEDINKRGQEILPGLQAEYEQIMRELEREQADVAEIEADDPEFLSELKVTIAEQNVEVKSLQAEVAESESQLKWLTERLEEIDLQKQESTNGIEDAQRRLLLQKNSTSVEVDRLKGELRSLEELLQFKVTKVASEMFEFVYASQFRINVSCINFQPVAGKTDICWVEGFRAKYRDDFPHLSDFLLQTAKDRVNGMGELSTSDIVQRLLGYWSCCTQLRGQIRLLNIKYPIKIHFQDHSFKITVPILFRSIKGKVIVSFTFDERTFASWPVNIASVKYDVEPKLGPVVKEDVFDTLASRMQQATPCENHAYLLDACISVSEMYPMP